MNKNQWYALGYVSMVFMVVSIFFETLNPVEMFISTEITGAFLLMALKDTMWSFFAIVSGVVMGACWLMGILEK